MIEKVTKKTFKDWLKLCLELWPDYNLPELHVELTGIFNSENQAAFLYKHDDGQFIACMNLSLRNDYVPGATSKPTGYIEGIYVVPEHRKKGIAKELIGYSSKWFISRGCKEVASDAVVTNTTSIEFHKALGFDVEETLVHFIKKIISF